jgi:hypothetical protein
MLPPYLMVSEPGSFARHTIQRRNPGIITQVIATQHYSDEILTALEALAAELKAGPVAPLPESAHDADEWRAALAPWAGAAWLELPWFLAETYFYRRLLHAVRYFEPGPYYLLDPFEPQKREALGEGLEAVGRYYATLSDLDLEGQFLAGMARCLWGNRADQSNISLAASSEADGEEAHRILIDHRRAIWQRLAAGQVRRLDWVADNSGPEILADMGLIGLLLAHGLVQRVHLHFKPQPFFVSDTMPKDYGLARQALEAMPDAASAELGALLRRAEEEGRIQIESHWFWTTSRHFTGLPDDLAAHLAGSDLILLKGDVNYRRLLEDRHWPHTTDLAAVTQFMPAPFVTLRTLKAELMVGLAPGEAEAIAAQDPEWLVTGERGLIHFVEPGV